MPPAIIGGVIAGVGAIGAASISSSAGKKAAKTAAAEQSKATDASLQIAHIQEKLFRDNYANNVEIHRPYQESGYGAQAVVNQLLGLKPLTAEQFNKGEWYTPGKVDYSAPAEVTAHPSPPPAQQAAPANLEDQAAAAIRAGADPLAVRARMVGMSQQGGGQMRGPLQ